ncbi:ATP-binding response regulator [Aquabacterium humicola]|uniref:ATP-binding response regulator n=1 Tax=Aquabacterium humicola TaxID=3237377 RepID=UPI002542E133|nr:response regulator [Rubrivivax pictus]
MNEPVAQAPAAARILVVEDEAIVALDLCQQLAAHGYDVCGSAGNAAAALALAREKRPDLVLMDVRLQGGDDGVEVAARLRDELGTPVVYLTAGRDAQSVQRATATRPFGYLMKPFDPQVLHAAVELALVRARSEAESAAQRARLEAAEAVARERSALLSRFSHELRTPLNAILGFGQLLQMSLAADEKLAGYAAHIVHGGEHLLALVDQVLEIQRRDDGVLPPELGGPPSG